MVPYQVQVGKYARKRNVTIFIKEIRKNNIMLFLNQKKQSKNYSLNSDKSPIRTIKTAVMMHKTVGGFKGAIQWLSTSPEERLRRFGERSWSSCHTINDRLALGTIYQIIPFEYRAWHGGGVTRRPSRALDVIGVRDPNNVCIGHEFTAWYDFNRNNILEPTEKAATFQQLNDFVDFMFYLEEQSIDNPWLDIKADADHLLTHSDTNHFKPDMEWEYEYVVDRMNNMRAFIKGPVEFKKIEEKKKNLMEIIIKLLRLLIAKKNI